DEAEEPEEWIETPHGMALVVPGFSFAPGETRANRQAAETPEPTPVPAPPEIDGYLKFDNLGILMEFDRYFREPTFRFVWDLLSFDTAHSVPRPNSLVNRSPAPLRLLVVSPNVAAAGQPPSGQDPKDMGYVSVTAQGLQQSRLTLPWFALQYELN